MPYYSRGYAQGLGHGRGSLFAGHLPPESASLTFHPQLESAWRPFIPPASPGQPAAAFAGKERRGRSQVEVAGGRAGLEAGLTTSWQVPGCLGDLEDSLGFTFLLCTLGD